MLQLVCSMVMHWDLSSSIMTNESAIQYVCCRSRGGVSDACNAGSHREAVSVHHADSGVNQQGADHGMMQADDASIPNRCVLFDTATQLSGPPTLVLIPVLQPSFVLVT